MDAQGRRLRVVKLLAPRHLVRTKAECPAVVDEFEAAPRKAGEAMPGSYVPVVPPDALLVCVVWGSAACVCVRCAQSLLACVAA